MASKQTGKATRGKASKPEPSSKATVATQRAIQRRIDSREKPATGAGKPKPKPVQAGTRKQPENPMPAQHLRKPGYEHELDLQPRFLAPDYTGSGKLEGMAAIVTGGDSGIGRAVAVLFAREGADVAILHLAEPRDAAVTKGHVENEGGRCIVIAGDVKDSAFCERAVRRVVKAFGRLDILVNNAAFQQHCERIEDLTDAHLQETLQ
ncbi:MAG: SDR family NAD(P)-dependent oxidoreductase, partial [Gammaproteobacteria bacterium]|nr:SDR family NAD(P)-dependent oxidoreductase [Gammaproteobacteria bacterium]